MKKLITVFLIFLILLFDFSFIVSADSAGPNYPSTIVSDSSNGGDVYWKTPENAGASDDAYAYCSLANGQISYYLKATNFGFSIPSDATINGIMVEIERHANQNTSTDYIIDEEVKLVKGGVPVGSNHASSVHWPTTDTWQTYGSSTDLWGTSWSPSDINSANFGVVLSVRCVAALFSKFAYVDTIRITVYYTVSANNPPTVSNPNPANGAVNVSIPTGGVNCSVYVDDADGDTLTVTWATNASTGVWHNVYTQTGIAAGTTVYHQYEEFYQYNTTYYWRVYVDDGTDNISSPIYHFTTEGTTYVTDWFDPSSCGSLYNEWKDPQNAYVDDSKYTTGRPDNTDLDEEDYYTFDISLPENATILGIEVGIDGRVKAAFPVPDDSKLKVKLSWNAGTSWSNEKIFTFTTYPDEETVIEGGERDLWGSHQWIPTDFSNTNFRLYARQIVNSSGFAASTEVDYIKIRIFYSLPPSTEVQNWKSPDVEEAGSGWFYLGNASDGDIRTFVKSETKTNPIYFNLTEPLSNCDRVRIFAYNFSSLAGADENPAIKIELLYNDNTWHEIYNGEITANQWIEIVNSDGEQTIKGAKVYTLDATSFATYTMIYEFQFGYKSTQDVTPPEIYITFAGNLSDKAGPYWIPSEGVDFYGSAASLADEGYYTNDSAQHENWIYINCTITDNEGIDKVWLNWYDVDTNTWTNWTYQLTNTVGNYWEINTSGLITITPGHNYSFNIVANDTAGNSKIARWDKCGHYVNNIVRRQVRLGCTPTSIDYKPIYLYEGIDISQDLILSRDDELHHDQATDAGPVDTGFMRFALPDNEVNQRKCARYVQFWFDDNSCIADVQIDNIYYHIWWSSQETDEVTFSWGKCRNHSTEAYRINYYQTRAENAVSHIVWSDGDSDTNDTYNLETHLLDTTLTQCTDNDIYTLFIMLQTVSANPSIISNRSIVSFIIINVPDNSTLQNQDTDNDGLNDYQELFITYTSPFLTDTDNDGYSDYQEYQENTDPNNFTDFPVNNPPVLSNPSASPSSGVADYTIFYFNITYSDADGDPPVEIKVNISKPGWYINVTMTYVSGDNITGALYSYSTTLSAGTYDYLFYATDGVDSTVNDPTDQVSVEAQSYSFTVSTADPSGQENFTASATMGAEWNVSASYQTSSIPAIQITNTGNVPINISINLTTTPISNVHIKYNTSSTPPSFSTDPYNCDKELTTTPVQVGSYIQPGDTLNIWLWADFENKYNPGEYTTSLWIESSSAT